MKQLIFAILLGILLASCSLFDSGIEWRGGASALTWIDIPEDVFLARDLGNGAWSTRIDARVFAVGWDGHYLVAQQHPKGDERITNFYILDSHKDGNAAEGIRC